MPSIEEAKARVKAERRKVFGAFAAVIGSRPLLAAFVALAVAFGSHLIYAPWRFPPIAGLQLAGAASARPDFGAVGQAARDAGDAAVRQGAFAMISEYLAANPILFPILNAIGFTACIALAIWTLWLNARQRYDKS